MSTRSPLKRYFSNTATVIVAGSALALAGCSDSDDPVQVSQNTFVRAFHAVPDAPPVDITFNGTTGVSALDFAENSGFARLSAGTYDIDVNAIVPGADPTVIDVDGLALANRGRTTIFAVGTVDATDGADRDISELVVNEPVNEPASDEISISVVHAAPAAGAVDIYITASGAVLAGATPIDADFKDSAELAAPVAAAAAYQVRITADGDASTVVYDSGELDLSGFAGQKVIVAAVNTTTQSEQSAAPVKLVAINDTTQVELLDTNTQAAAKVAHLSPDAADAAGGDVEVFANDAVELIPAFAYGDVVANTSDYALVDAGDYVFDVSPDNDANDDSVYSSGTLSLAAGSETTVLAVGYVAGSGDTAFELITSADENRAYGTHARVKVIHAAAAVANVDVYVAAAGDFNSANIVTAGPDALLSNFAYKGDSGYVDLAAGDYDIFVAAAGTDTIAIEALNVTVSAGNVLSIIARGADESVGAAITTAGLLVLSN